MLNGAKSPASVEAHFYTKLVIESLMLPFVFRCQVLDMDSVLASDNGGFSYSMAGMDDSEAERWRDAGIKPELAGYWHIYRFDVEDVMVWVRAGFGEPIKAAAWRMRGFDVNSAVEWYGAGFNAQDSFMNKLMGYTEPLVAAAWKKETLKAQAPIK